MTRSERPSNQRSNRLVAVTLDENSIGRSNPDVEHERAVAIYDLLEDNLFAPKDDDGGPFALHLSITGTRLVFDIRHADGAPVVAHLLSLSPLRRIVKDYYMVCDSYYAAIRTATPDRIEALDMGRRALHDEILPALAEFAPDFLLVSAGFDAWRSDPLGGMRVTGSGFEEWGRELARFARERCGGRMLSLLEGGYDLEALPHLTSGYLAAQLP